MLVGTVERGRKRRPHKVKDWDSVRPSQLVQLFIALRGFRGIRLGLEGADEDDDRQTGLEQHLIEQPLQVCERQTRANDGRHDGVPVLRCLKAL